MWIKQATLSALLLLSQNAPSTAFMSPNPAFKTMPLTSLGVIVGLGPGEGKVDRDENEKMIFEDPDHELYRQSRLTKFDEKCDAWFSSLLGSSPGLDEISEKTLSHLNTPVELKDEVCQDQMIDFDCVTSFRKIRDPLVLTFAFSLEPPKFDRCNFHQMILISLHMFES